MVDISTFNKELKDMLSFVKVDTSYCHTTKILGRGRCPLPFGSKMYRVLSNHEIQACKINEILFFADGHDECHGLLCGQEGNRRWRLTTICSFISDRDKDEHLKINLLQTKDDAFQALRDEIKWGSDAWLMRDGLSMESILKNHGYHLNKDKYVCKWTWDEENGAIETCLTIDAVWADNEGTHVKSEMAEGMELYETKGECELAHCTIKDWD